MKYYKFEGEFNWEELSKAVEEAEENGYSCDEMENAMFDLMKRVEPIEVDEVDESVDGLYVDDEEIDKSLGEDNEYVFGYVVYDGNTLYEFEFDKSCDYGSL